MELSLKLATYARTFGCSTLRIRTLPCDAVVLDIRHFSRLRRHQPGTQELYRGCLLKLVYFVCDSLAN